MPSVTRHPGQRPGELARQADGATLLVTVRDSGRGIAAEELERIFEPNFRGDHGFPDYALHLGLGLAIMRRLLNCTIPACAS